MRTLICVPTMGTVKTRFLESFMRLETGQHDGWTLTSNSVIHHAREELTMKAKRAGAEYILWLDSDMTFSPDTLLKLLADKKDFVTALAFTKRIPPRPTLIERMYENKGDIYYDYPKDSLFQIEGCGMACCLVKTRLIKEGDFLPLNGLGEDYSFCKRLKDRGVEMWCDSRIKCGHIGDFEWDETVYIASR